MKLSIATFLACLASPAVGRLSGVRMHNEATDETLPVPNLEYSNKQTDQSLRLEKLAAIDGFTKRISTHRMPGRDLKKANDQGVEEIHVGKFFAEKANLLANNNEGGRHLESEGYQNKLKTIVAEANRFASSHYRNLEASEKRQPLPSSEFQDMGSQVYGLAREREGRGLQEDIDPDSETCIQDTDVLIKANPLLDQAIDSYIASAMFTEYYDATNDLNYKEITYSVGAESTLEAACASAGGYFDENTGLIACGYGSEISLSKRYVSCLANTPECQTKDNFEFLEMALENAGWYCLVDVPSEAPSEAPTGAPGVVVSSEDSGSVGSTVTSPTSAANFDACILETNMMAINNPDLYTAKQAYIDSLDGAVDPLTGYVNFGYSEDAKTSLQSACTAVGGYFDVNEGTLTCDLSSEFSSTVTTTVTGHVNCLANIPACTDKNHYSHLQQALENEGFFNCRVLGVPGPAVTTAMPTPAPTNAATTLAPVFPSTGSCSLDTDVLYNIHDDVGDETLTFIESLEYTVSAGEIYYYYSNDAADDLKDVCDDAGGYFVQAKKSLHCLIDYEGITIETETADYAMCLAPTDACYDSHILDFLELFLADVGYYDCYIG